MHWVLQRPVNMWLPGSVNTCSVPPAFGHAQSAQCFDGEVLDPLINPAVHARHRVTVVVCVCVCVCPVRFFQTVTNQPRRPMDRLSAAIT